MPYVNSAYNTQMMCNVFSYYYFYQRNGFKNTSPKGHCCLMINTLKITVEKIMCNDKTVLFWVIYTTLN